MFGSGVFVLTISSCQLIFGPGACHFSGHSYMEAEHEAINQSVAVRYHGARSIVRFENRSMFRHGLIELQVPWLLVSSKQ